MADIVFLQARVDFSSQLSLHEVAQLISTNCFGGIGFTGLNEGIWDEIPAMRLEKPVLGLEVNLGGSAEEAEGYTLEVASNNPYGGVLGQVEGDPAAGVCEFSSYLAGYLKKIPGLEVADS
jgi:hypothetical protein